MAFFRLLFFLILFSSSIFAKPILINDKKDFEEILSKSEIYIDETQKMTVDKIREVEFKQNSKEVLSFGYDPKFDVWIKFTLKNNTNRNIERIVEYGNSLTTDVQFYYPNNKMIEKGLLYKNSTLNTINPSFEIELKANESKTYLIKATTHITTLIIKLNLWKEKVFFNDEIKHQIILSLFFGAMFILALYNLFIFFFTKDISYLYYVLYIFGIIIHHLLYTGIAKLYFLDPNTMKTIVELASIVVAIPVIALGLFTKSFLQIEQYPKNLKLLNGFLILIPLSILFFLLTDDYDKYRNLLTMIFLVYLMLLTIFATVMRNQQAYFILFGWFIFLSSGMLMYLSSAGIFNVYIYFPYLIEVSFVLEAIIFSIALAHRINRLQKERNEANEKLLIQKQNETQRLTKEVELRTKDLKNTVDEKELLLKELNHRVKNNMQMIVSLIRLQADDIVDKKSIEVLTTVQNRINAMSHLHELLYKQDNIKYINAYEYIEILIEEVSETYIDDVLINLNIKTELKIEDAIYCGLILNELITNSFKYAFKDHFGNINITLVKKDDMTELVIKDDGIGYDTKNTPDSLGLTLVKTLAVNQLKGDINIVSSNGVETTIRWKEDVQT